MAYEVTWVFFLSSLSHTHFHADGIPCRQRSCPYRVYFALRAPSRRYKPRNCYEMAPFVQIRPSQTSCPHYYCSSYGCPGLTKMRGFVMERISKRGHVRCMCCFSLPLFLRNFSYQQAEDWQSDKCEVNLLEGVPEGFIVKRLDSAVRFVSESPYSSCFCLSQGRHRLDWRTSSRKLEIRIDFSTSTPSGICSLYFKLFKPHF
jgi:hypothetical protein